MDPHEFYRYSSVCFKNNITIYPIPVNNSGLYKIAVNRNGREKIGKELYKDKAVAKTVKVETPRGIVKKETIVPAVADRMGELYRDIAIKNKFISE